MGGARGGEKTPRRVADADSPRRKPALASPATKQQLRRRVTSKEEVGWPSEERYGPSRRSMTTPELGAARRMFFELDRNGSGSIDVDELGVMMRSLGQSPTDEELEELVRTVDGGEGGRRDRDGQIQLREFLELYQRGLETRNAASSGDINDCFLHMGGDPSDKGSRGAR